MSEHILKLWHERKEYFLNRLMKEDSEGRTDKDIMELLELINSQENYYSTSSCSGRIQIIEGRTYSKRKELRSIAKFHYGVSKEEFKKALNKIEGDYAWISLQPPILHIACKNLDDALKILKLARSSGFKHSGIQAKNPDRYVVELNSSFRLDIPLKYKGKFLLNFNEMDLIIEILNENLKLAKLCILRFKEAILNMHHGNKDKRSLN
ncbi:MAG TPA: hypothetical protein VKU94_07660 [Geobacterales bacterium]|nr:hypothetical protein [Geobacterales bacterium]